MLGAMTVAASGLALACATTAAAASEHFVHAPGNASINIASSVPIEVDPARFATLTTEVANHWQITIDGATLATAGARDGVNSIGFSATLPQDVLGAYIYWPRRVYKAQKLCVRRANRRRVCRRVKRYVHTEITEADVAFSTAFYWNQGPGYPGSDQIDLPTVEFHELGHFHDPNRPHGHRCSGSPLTESLGYGEWWRSRSDWYEEYCTSTPAAPHQKLAAASAPPSPIFTRVVHPLPDRTVGRNRP
jgi:hypothetical protein